MWVWIWSYGWHKAFFTVKISQEFDRYGRARIQGVKIVWFWDDAHQIFQRIPPATSTSPLRLPVQVVCVQTGAHAPRTQVKALRYETPQVFLTVRQHSHLLLKPPTNQQSTLHHYDADVRRMSHTKTTQTQLHLDMDMMEFCTRSTWPSQARTDTYSWSMVPDGVSVCV